uniref:Uncharacterized protein n=1 Tax=Ditylenchus dipsaci TaxID=166011 RepID=A0A915E3M7_9BILA
MQRIDDPETYIHVACQKVLGINLRRSIQAELAAGPLEKPSTSRVRCDRRIVEEFTVNETDFLEIRDADIGSVQATESAMYRAKRKNFPPIMTYQEILAP